ncbi:NAD(P)/FAD-dependent oxidoreductase [Micropruina sonneratiae]|uniref:NAD(P)/FAD-dependent oxidoreductase n=1 Tax=Micropruina sonneratiae TaxID=2986940 RepID=UPI0022275859|nr:NAD(P)/FAD-dependent oxidoreductase [Micropruina sp. KQZ13P-5]MCW3159479.1 NAD(P)/FAD-dependent oxidoreductase [Micropruina sp. KQZ13P-5]
MNNDEQASADTTDVLPETADVVVIGGGAAGLNGALMLARSRRRVVVIDSGTPRNAPAAGVHGLLALDGTAPAALYRTGRAEVRSYGGGLVDGVVRSAQAVEPGDGGDPRFAVELEDGRSVVARRLLIATGVTDLLPDVPGLARHWGGAVVHCPYCHGWEVRDQPIGVLATSPMAVHQALLFRQLTDDLVFFAGGLELDEATRKRFAALAIEVVDTPVAEVVTGAGGGLAGVRLVDGSHVARTALAVASRLEPRLEGLAALGLPVADLPAGMGRHVPSQLAGTTTVPGVRVAGNVTDPTAQVGASAATGALAGAHLNAELVMADADAAVAASSPLPSG